ncbi:DNA polymerase III subunit epsilon [Corynebacterium variabile]|uniref:DNA polymerase III subunit epsilon n=1 Tax=Corynebacterium variabile TaxID=1727 RepID=UPI002649F46F|nr:DNA polymerase III subunit epsilon [Corynebacterium variabile]MDN6240528.1 DNA polymerase III subunit epsilon [Corynebacterium variabile]
MTSTGPDNDSAGTSGTTGDSGATGAPTGGRSRRRRRRQVHRRAAPPSPDMRRATRSTQDAASPADSPDAGTDSTAVAATRPTRVPKTFHGEIPDAETAPFVALTVAASGIHPTTSRLVAVAAVLYDAEGHPVSFTGNRPACSDGSDLTGGTSTAADADPTELTGVVQQINPGEDPGPWHLHGYTEADLGQAPGFATVAPLLFSLLDGRTVICHDTTVTWGFIIQEYRRAQRAANRSAPQGGNRGRRRNTRRPRKIAVPVPERIVDTMTTARRQSVPVIDPRLRSIAAHYRGAEGLELAADTLPDLGAVASEARTATGADELLLADARILLPLHLVQEDLADAGRGIIQSALPADLTADRFGLQRSTIRVDATTTPRPFANPGVPGDDGRLTEGMEFVVSPDVATDPDEIISAGLRAGLVYSEKLNRTSSLVVCNANHELRGKAMHAHRKNIPLFTDTGFFDALEDVETGTASTGEPETRPATPRIPAPQRGGQGRPRKKQGGRQGTKHGAKQGAKQGGRQGSPQSNRRTPIRQPQQHGEDGGTDGGNGASSSSSGSGSTGSSGNRNRNRNRRRSSGNSGGQQKQGQQKQGQAKQGSGGNSGSGSNRSGARRRRRSGANRRQNQSNQSK